MSKPEAPCKSTVKKPGKRRDWRGAAPEYCSVDQLAIRLGFHAHSIYRLVKRDPLFPKPIRIGGRLRFLIADVDDYLLSCREEAVK